MKNKLTTVRSIFGKRLLLLIMKTFIFLLCTTVFSFNTENSFSQEKVLIAKDQTVTVDQVFEIIKHQTKYRFIYPRSLFKDAPKVHLEKGEILVSKLLEKSLSKKHLNFNFSKKNTIIIKEQASLPKLIKPIKVQTIKITGNVSDATGPLPGASVLEKGTTNGVQTDFDGNFSLSVSGKDAVIVVSYIGFSTQEIAIGDKTSILVKLIEDASALDEIVVIGYGTQKKSNISGSVSQVDQKEIEKNPSPNLSNSLVGNATGIIATQRSGEPGNDGSNIFIRGIGTTGNKDPLYVIDGIVRSASDFAQISSDEIATFSVLKDAASSAVFGVRAGNGIILVTTKRGKSGKMQIGFSSNLGVQERTRIPEFLNSYEYSTLYNEALTNQGDTPLFSDDDIQKYKDGSSPDTHPDSDWFSVLKKSAVVQKYNITANGGTDKLQYATSLGYLKQEGIVPSNVFKRYNFRSNIDAKVTNTTKLSFDISGRDEDVNNVASGDVFRWMSGIPPNRVPIKWSNGTYSNGPSFLALPDNGYRKNRIQVFQGRIELEQELPVEGLSIKGIASYDKRFTDYKSWRFTKTPFYNRISEGVFEEGIQEASNLFQRHIDYQSITLESHLNYTKSFGKNNLTALVLYTQTKETSNTMEANRIGYTLGIDELDFGGAEERTNRGYSGTSGRQGVVGRLNWTYNDKYILEGSIRADASEQFAPGKRWGYFPSASVGYIMSKESFLEDSEIIDFLKLRGSYGILGNDRLGGNSFLYLQAYNVSGNAVFGDGNVQQAIVEGRLSNPNVTWETVKKLNIGLDATLWKGKLTASVDYFSDKRSDILGNRILSVPSLLGATLPIENLAKVDNSGIEIALGHRNYVNDDLSYSMNANFTYAKNKVVFIDEAELDNPNIRRTGQPIGTQFGLRALGLFQTQEEVDNAPTQIGSPAPGDIRYADISGPDGVPDGEINDFDRTAIGASNVPEIIFGYNGNIKYKDFEFSFLLQGATNVNQYYSGEGAWPFFVGSGGLKSTLDRWTPTNTGASEPRVLIDADKNHQTSSFWLRDASYLRLKTLELAYNVPLEKLQTNLFTSMRIYINANNVATWSKIKNFDPENASGRGWDYPQFRTWNIGVNFKL